MLNEPEVSWKNLPLMGHRGLIISRGIINLYSLEDLRYKFLSIKMEKGFEKIQENCEIKLIEKIHNDSIWIVKWFHGAEKQIAMILGSEF